MDKSKNSDEKIILNNEICINQQNKIDQNKNEKDEEIIIELEISNNEKEKEIYY